MQEKYYGKYSGKVMSVKDLKQLGRIRVQIPSIIGKEEVWALPCFPPGRLAIPEVDSQVWVEFEAGNILHPIWVGVWYTEENKPKVYETIFPKTVIFQGKEGELKIEISEKPLPTITISHSKGSEITMEADGSVNIKADSFFNVTSNNVNIKGGLVSSIELGKNTQNVILFDNFKRWWDTQVVPAWSAHQHICTGAPGPGAPTITPLASPEKMLVASQTTKVE